MLLLWVGSAAADYAVLVINYPLPPYTVHDTTEIMDEWYLNPGNVGSGALQSPPSSNNKYLFWDADEVYFESGVPCEDFPNQWISATAIEAAVDAWEDVDSGSLDVIYDGEDVFETNDPDDGENVIFFGEHSSLGGVRGITMITAPTSGVNIGEFSDVDIVLNDAKLWTTGTAICATPSDTSDVQSTATHEVGHALGLGHVTGKHCMTSSSQWCSGGTILKTAYENLEQRTIQTGDQDGYEYLYVDTDNVRETFGGGPNDKPIAGADETDASQAGVVAFPNPFNPSVSVAFHVGRTSVTSASIYNTLGQEIRELQAPQSMEPGDYQLVWDGRDASGQVMASGRYFLRVALGSEVHSFQLALVR